MGQGSPRADFRQGCLIMRWIFPTYYICISLVVLFLLLTCIAFPLAFIIVVPLSVFLLAIPSLVKSNKFKDAALKEAEDRVLQLTGEGQQLRISLSKATAVLNENMSVLSLCVPVMDGVVYERYVGNRLRLEGYTEIQFTRKTGDFGGDIIALDPNGIKTCVQCKRYQDNVGIESVQEAISGRIYYQCEKAMVVSNKAFTPAAKELAEKAGVELRGVFL